MGVVAGAAVTGPEEFGGCRRRTPGKWSNGASVIASVPESGWGDWGAGVVYAATIDKVQEIHRTLIDAPTNLFELGDRAVFAPTNSAGFPVSAA